MTLPVSDLEASEDPLPSYAKQAAASLLVFGQDGRFLDVNPHTCASLGYSREELLCMSVSDIDTEFDLTRAQSVWETILPGHPLTLLTRQRRKDGTTFPVELQFSSFDVQGTRRYMGLARDITERNRVETALRESEEKFRALANSIPQMVHIARADGFFIWYNQRWYDYTGTTPQDMEGWGWQSVHDPEVLPRVMAQWKAAIAAGEPFEMEFPLRGADGQFRQFLTRVVPVRNASGQIAQWAATNTDVDELKRVEETKRAEAKAIIHRGEQLLRSLIGGVVDYAIYLLDAEGRIQTWNSGAKLITGYEADEIIGRNVSTFFTAEDQAASAPEQALEFARRDGRFETEAWRVRKDGRQFLAHVIIDAIRDEAGVINGFAKITRDITEIKRAEQDEREKQRLADEVELQRVIAEERERAARVCQKTNKLLNAIIDSSPIGICTVNASGVIEIYNPACERIYGYSAAEMVGRSRQELYEKVIIQDEVSAEQSWPPVVSYGDNGLLEGKRRRKDGTIVDVSIAQATHFEVDGVTLGVLRLITDVTERKAMEEQLRQSQKMESIGQLTGGIAHDFNNLLTVIICNLELMIESSGLDSEVQNSARMALDASLRGAELIEQMLAFARKQRLEPRVVQVNDLVSGMTSMLRRSLGEQIEITLRMAPDPWTTELDPAQLQTALANLATNSRDAMPRGGSLVIETANIVLDESYVGPLKNVAPGDYVLVSVSDSGVGMPPEVVARAFDPFFTTKAAHHGTGLGLSMVFGFVKQSNGHIRIYSEEGHGTTIKLYLPRAKSAEVQQPVAEPTPARNLAGTILVVEDNIALAKSIEGMLRRAGFSLFVAHSAKAALDILDAGTTIDLLFTDVILASGMNGIELASEATARRPGLKILFTSGFAESALTVSGKAAVSDRMVSKPYKSADLLTKIAQALANDHHSFDQLS